MQGQNLKLSGTSVTKNFIDTAVFSKSCVPGPKYIPGSFDK